MASVLAPAPARGEERDGAFLGAGIGVGAMTFTEADQELEAHDSMAMRVSLGGMISPRLALLVELDQMRGDAPVDLQDARFEVQHRSLTAGLRFWPFTRLWLQLSLGRAWARAVDPLEPDRSPDGWGGTSLEGTTSAFGIGFEVLREEMWSVDLVLRGGGSGYGADVSSSQGSIAAAFHWFDT